VSGIGRGVSSTGEHLKPFADLIRMRKKTSRVFAGSTILSSRSFSASIGHDQACCRPYPSSTSDYPQCRIRVLHGSGRVATNDKVAKLARLVSEAAYDVWSSATAMCAYTPISVATDRSLRDKKVGAVTCFYVRRMSRLLPTICRASA